MWARYNAAQATGARQGPSQSVFEAAQGKPEAKAKAKAKAKAAPKAAGTAICHEDAFGSGRKETKEPRQESFLESFCFWRRTSKRKQEEVCCRESEKAMWQAKKSEIKPPRSGGVSSQ